MSTEQTQENEVVADDETQIEQPDQLTMLKQRARMMGIPFSNNISIETLKAKIEAKMNGEVDPIQKADSLEEENLLQDPVNVPVKAETLRQRLHRENMRLIRLRIVNLDPKKKDLPGEIFTVANEVLGTVRKYVPFGEVTEDGYHVPYWIYKVMKSRKFLNIRTFKDRKNNNQIRVEQSWAPEFALEVLPPLTQAEITKLAVAQAAAGGLS